MNAHRRQIFSNALGIASFTSLALIFGIYTGATIERKFDQNFFCQTQALTNCLSDWSTILFGTLISSILSTIAINIAYASKEIAQEQLNINKLISCSKLVANIEYAKTLLSDMKSDLSVEQSIYRDCDALDTAPSEPDIDREICRKSSEYFDSVLTVILSSSEYAIYSNTRNDLYAVHRNVRFSKALFYLSIHARDAQRIAFISRLNIKLDNSIEIIDRIIRISKKDTGIQVMSVK